jgi:uncharacterized membrane protein
MLLKNYKNYYKIINLIIIIIIYIFFPIIDSTIFAKISNNFAYIYIGPK